MMTGCEMSFEIKLKHGRPYLVTPDGIEHGMTMEDVVTLRVQAGEAFMSCNKIHHNNSIPHAKSCPKSWCDSVCTCGYDGDGDV